MKANVGTSDRVIRIIVGLALIAVAVFVDLGIWRWIIGVIGGIWFVVAVVGFCPIYPLLKINTIKKGSA